MPELEISPLAVVALVALAFVLIAGVANHHTRPFVVGLVVFIGLAVVLLGFVAERKAARVQRSESRSIAVRRAEPRPVEAPPVPPPPVPETRRQKVSFGAALREAVVKALTTRDVPTVAEAPDPKGAPPAKPAPAEKPKPQGPGWVDAPPKMEDGCYMTSLWVGPFTTELECERKLPSALQGAVSEYAELLLGPEAAVVRLPDEVLQKLVKDRWKENRPMEIGGGTQDMVSLHALVVFDGEMQQRIKAEAQRLVAERRVQGADRAGRRRAGPPGPHLGRPAVGHQATRSKGPFVVPPGHHVLMVGGIPPKGGTTNLGSLLLPVVLLARLRLPPLPGRC